MYMSAGLLNNFQLPFGNAFLYQCTFRYATSRQQDRHVNGRRTYANPDKYDGDTNTTKERCLSRKL
jgi:hypothetical protein